MFFPTMTIPQNYGYVEKVKSNAYTYYDKIFKDIIINSTKNNSTENNNIIGDDYIMPKDIYFKSFFELVDVANNKIIKLSKKLEFVISTDEYGFYYSNKQYNIYVYGENQQEAENSLYDELLFQYNSYVYEDDNDLDSGAKKLKYNLLSLFDVDAKI